MKLYFSGISDKDAIAMLQSANTSHWLIDQFDLVRLQESIPKDVELVLDCGAYKLWKQEKRICVGAYLKTINYFLKKGFKFSKIVAPDVFGDFEATWDNWERVKHLPHPWMPVWGWGNSYETLLKCLDEAPVVGIGGLVPLMREGQWKKTPAAHRMLEELVSLCEEFPNRLHIFGINWLKAIEQCQLAASGDTSKAWDGARYAHIIFQNTKTGRLQQCKSDLIPEYAHLYRPERCIESAKTLNNYCNKPMNFTVELHPDQIIVVFTHEPTCYENGRKIVAMLDKAGFKPQSNCKWVRDRTDFWVEQCRKLAQKFGATVVETSDSDHPKSDETLCKLHKVDEPDPIAELRNQLLAMQQEMSRLKQEVEELKKFDAIAD